MTMYSRIFFITGIFVCHIVRYSKYICIIRILYINRLGTEISVLTNNTIYNDLTHCDDIYTEKRGSNFSLCT